MKKLFTIIPLLLLANLLPLTFFGLPSTRDIRFEFYGETIDFQIETTSIVEFKGPLSQESVQNFYAAIQQANFQPAIKALLNYKEKHKPDDWLFYQLIRKTAQQISPKAANYDEYTLYKWFFLVQTGYDAILSIAQDKILFYVQSDENIYNIPSRISHNKQYVCLNYHDYGSIDFEKYKFAEVIIPKENALKGFTYRITQLPDFNPEDYKEKDIRFTYYDYEYHFKIKLNPQIHVLFNNYPVVDYGYYFNIPLSKETYASLIPAIRKNIKGMNVKNGIDYLMRFTRYAFIYEKDSEHFGKEKRLSPEETLLYEQSDCEDRAALFFYLVKEIYDLPMIVLAYPTHVTVAVQFDKAVGHPIIYNGNKYYVCEPTPQKTDLRIGESIPSLNKVSYEVAYAYTPKQK
jgi:hypothetical protein